jgi:hypothetical protein
LKLISKPGVGSKLHNITKCLLTIAAFLGCVALYSSVQIPGLAPLLCPWCLGFERLEPGLFIEASASGTVRQQTEATFHDSKPAVGRYFGPLQSDPAIFVCVTENCYLRGERRQGKTIGISFLDWVILLSPRGNTKVALMHELSHTELHRRLGLKMFAVPTWFDEGLAVNISDDPRFLAPPGSDTRCVVPRPTRLPANGATWVSATEATGTPYAEAACLVSMWLDRQDRASAILTLVSDIKAGIPFARAYAS